MCKQDAVIEVISDLPDKGGMSKTMLNLAKAQAEDYKILRKEVVLMSERLSEVEKRIDKNGEKIDRILANQKRPSIWGALHEIFSNKIFLYLLISFICACLGVSVGEVGLFLFK